MCNLDSITTNQAAIIALFRVINRYVGNLSVLRWRFASSGMARECDPWHSFAIIALGRERQL
jgi:hypothetical protein